MTRAEREAVALRQLADAIEQAERARRWLDGPPPANGRYVVLLSWEWGRGVAGYEELRSAVQARVEASMAECVRAALAVLEARVDAARGRLNDLRGVR